MRNSNKENYSYSDIEIATIIVANTMLCKQKELDNEYIRQCGYDPDKMTHEQRKSLLFSKRYGNQG